MGENVTGYRYIYIAVQAGFYGDAVECLTATREIRVQSPSGSGPKIFFFTCHIPMQGGRDRRSSMSAEVQVTPINVHRGWKKD